MQPKPKVTIKPRGYFALLLLIIATALGLELLCEWFNLRVVLTLFVMAFLYFVATVLAKGSINE